MRIVDAEPQLVAEILEEMEVTESHKKKAFIVHIGHHPSLGRMVVIEAKDGQSAIVEME